MGQNHHDSLYAGLLNADVHCTVR